MKDEQEKKAQEILNKVARAGRGSDSDGEEDEDDEPQDQPHAQDTPKGKDGKRDEMSSLQDGLKALAQSKRPSKAASKAGPKPDALAKGKKERKPKGDKEKGAKGGGAGGPRTGAKANKEALAEIQRKLDQCIMRDEFEASQAGVTRAITSVTVFKT